MKRTDLANLIRSSSCRVFGAQDASNKAHRSVLAKLIKGFNHPDSTVLCEPSLAKSTVRPPDAVVVDLIAGLHVIEVKGVSLEQLDSIEPGGQFKIRYGTKGNGVNPFAQVRKSMFEIKDAVERLHPSDIAVPFKYWVVLATITRNQWLERWGQECFCPPELLFQDDLSSLSKRLREHGESLLAKQELANWPTDQIQSIWRAFGDSSVLFPTASERKPRKVRKGTLGELFDEAAETYKTLSDEQQRISMQMWENGPRLVRGVAGSGKTIVLANNLARRVHRSIRKQQSLFETHRTQRIAAVCFNRTLAPFLKKKIDIAFRQRTGRAMPEGQLEVWSYNRLMFDLSKKGLWRYQNYENTDDDARAIRYFKELAFVKQNDPSTFDRCVFDAIYVDEGQDFLEEDFRLLKELCRTDEDGEPSLFVFYDDAQNLYGRTRPNWHSLGLNIVGRSQVMTECFRNTRQILEPAFNVLYASFAEEKSKGPTKTFGDIATLEEKGLLRRDDDMWRIGFAKRDGLKPKVNVSSTRTMQRREITNQLRYLIEEQQVRPEDIHLLVFFRNQIDKLVRAIEEARIPSVEGIHVATAKKDDLLHQRGWLSISTVASAKGYDAYAVLLCGADEFPTDVQGRASFYVACTRAIEYLEVFGTKRAGLLQEFEKALSTLD